MKSFVSKIFRFLAILLSVIFTIWGVNRYFSNFSAQGHNRTLVIGHSHSSCSINDTLIPGLINRSNPGEAYLYNFFKTRELLKQNPEIENLLIEFSNDQLDYDIMSQWIWGDDFLMYNFPKYGAFMDWQTYRMLNSKNPKMFVKSVSMMWRKNFEMLFRKLDYNKNDIGGYTLLTGSNVDRKLDAIESRKQVFKKEILALNNLRYLEKTIVFARKRGVHVYLIRSPLHLGFMEYENLDNEKILQEIVDNFKSKYPGLDFLDFSDFPLTDEEFKDLDHLNGKGATHFSTWLSALIEDGLFEKEDKSYFVQERIRKLQQMEGLEYEGLR